MKTDKMAASSEEKDDDAINENNVEIPSSDYNDENGQDEIIMMKTDKMQHPVKKKIKI